MFSNKDSSFPASKEYFASWKQVPNLASDPQYFHASVIHNDLMVILGGRDFNELRHTVTVVDLSSQKMLNAYKSSSAQQQIAHTMCLYEDLIIVYGGQENNKIIEFRTINKPSPNPFGSVFKQGVGDVAIMCENSERFARASRNAPELAFHTANVYQHNMYVFGGLRRHSSTLSQALWELDLRNMVWTQCESQGQIPRILGARFSHCSAIHKSNLYIFGGNLDSLKPQYVKDLYKVDLNNFEWELVDANGTPPMANVGASMHEFGEKLFVFGGCSGMNLDDKRLNDVFTFCLKTNTWTKLLLSPGPSPRAYHTSGIWNNQLYIFGGAGDQPLADMWYFNLEGDNAVTNEGDTKMKEVQRGLKIENEAFGLIQLFEAKSFTDIILEVEGKEFPCHKAILAQRCKFFANLFSSGMADSNLTKLKITYVKTDSFEVMLRFIYGDPNLAIDEDMAFELLSLSDKYLLPSLKTQCETVLTKLLTLENFVKIAKAAEMVESDVIKGAVFRFARQNINTLKERGDLYNLSQSILIELFANIVAK